MISKINDSFQVPDYFVGTIGNDEQISQGTEKIFNLCSMSKFVTSVLCLKLIQEGSLSLSTSLRQFISTNSDITIEDILRHMSGIIDDEKLFVENIKINKNDYLTDFNLSPNKEFSYSDHAFVILEFFLEDRYNMTFSDLVFSKLFQPLGMESMHYIASLSDINPATFVEGFDKTNKLIPQSFSVYPFPAACGLWGNGPDLTILVNEVLCGFQGNSKLGISKELYSQLTESTLHDWLGLGCFLDTTPQGGKEISSLGWGVGYQSMLIVHPQQKKGLIVLTNKDTGVHQMKGLCGAVYQEWMNGKF